MKRNEIKGREIKVFKKKEILKTQKEIFEDKFLLFLFYVYFYFLFYFFNPRLKTRLNPYSLLRLYCSTGKLSRPSFQINKSINTLKSNSS